MDFVTKGKYRVSKNGQHGNWYHLSIAFLLFLQMGPSDDISHMAYEHHETGVFDDIVLFNEKKKELYCFQVKHAQASNDMTFNQFDLLPFHSHSYKPNVKYPYDLIKYLKCYTEITKKYKKHQCTIKPYILTNREFTKPKHYFQESIVEQVPGLPIISGFAHIKLKPTDKTIRSLIRRIGQLQININKEQIVEFFDSLILLKVPDNLEEAKKSELWKFLKLKIPPQILGKLKLDPVLTAMQKDFRKRVDFANRDEMRTLNKSDVDQSLKNVKEEHKLFASSEAKKTLNNYANRQIIDHDTGRSIDDKDFIANLAKEIFKGYQYIILLADPGMGKTAMLKFAAYEVQKQSNVEVFLVNCSELSKKIDGNNTVSNIVDALRMFNDTHSEKAAPSDESPEEITDVLSKESCSKIKDASATQTNTGYSIIFILDGLDEIPEQNRQCVVKVLTELGKKKSIRFIISSRPYVWDSLRKHFPEEPKKVHLSGNDNFESILQIVWMVKDKNDSHFVKYSKQILKKFHSLIPLKFLHNSPLMIKTIAEISAKNFDRFRDGFPIDTELNILMLCEKFVENCVDLTNDERYRYTVEPEKLIKDLKYNCSKLEAYQCLARKELGVQFHPAEFLSKSFTNKYDTLRKAFIEASEKSILIKVVDNEVKFHHKFYSEYFLALYVYDNIPILDKKLVIDCFEKFADTRYLVMNKLGRNKDFHKELNDLYDINCKIVLWACESGCLNTVSALITNSRKIDYPNLYEMYRVSAENDYPEIYKFLLNNHPIDMFKASEDAKQKAHTKLMNKLGEKVISDFKAAESNGCHEKPETPANAQNGNSSLTIPIINKNSTTITKRKYLNEDTFGKKPKVLNKTHSDEL